ncbi:DUF3120 domain-containing protein [Gloeocapsopsis dulcis]|uniref:DUF3120 domain-containing protein n=1 Tax=Gloeocapsopsis dulcis AAB1 = 1H9 TaxID=1433147 RepID=A0A6N8G0U7_9CHRO|nr:DUF3120 domain-containing protein [Gloeocapsopsis dulcis]MUL38719.1 hypothetical protein [Gloeocapsopsis dulcis AAB1 = 1H9]WNN88863.1 DUF3120 domain-containing protein [Gloeocapsopsis dulcis]
MVNHTSSSYSASVPTEIGSRQAWLVFAAAVFLVSVPVFIEAPLVRSLPSLSLALTGGWIALSLFLMSRPTTHFWGDLLFGFSWSWLAGSLYWGWLRWEPLLHLPVEAIALPFAILCIRRNWGLVGSFFYLGSLFGTVVTDIYFYLVDLIPYWRQLMQIEPVLAAPILQSALAQVYTPWGQLWAFILASVLLTVGILPLIKKELHFWAFSGAVLSTILVDILFWLAALAA